MESLFARFEPLIALALHAHGTPQGRACPWDELDRRMHELVMNERHTPAPGSLTAEALADCRLAVYTFVDERLFESPRLPDAQGTAPAENTLGWFPYSLQNRYLGDTNGGERFYDRLAALLDRLAAPPEPVRDGLALTDTRSASGTPAQQWNGLLARWRTEGVPQTDADAQTLTVFAQCLACGFEGRLHRPEDSETRQALRQAACETLLLCLDRPTTVPLPPPPSRFTVRQTPLRTYEPLLYVVIPLVITVLWYCACADMLTRIVLS